MGNADSGSILDQLQVNAWQMIQTLRREVTELKRCQVQYFSLSVTATGAILGLAAAVTGKPDGIGLAMLSPLALLLPCWVIFFDKATTITRLVGFQRAIESAMWGGHQEALAWLLAWESALGDFRHAQDSGDLEVHPPKNRPHFLGVLCLRTRHRYWMANWYTFFLLSSLACILGYNYLESKLFDFRLPLGIEARIPEHTLWGLPAFAGMTVVGAFTLVVVVHLVRGKHSYEANTTAWKDLVEQKTGCVLGAPGKKSA